MLKSHPTIMANFDGNFENQCRFSANHTKVKVKRTDIKKIFSGQDSSLLYINFTTQKSHSRKSAGGEKPVALVVM